MKKFKITNFKLIFFIVSVCIIILFLIKASAWFLKTDLYYIFSGQSVSLEELMNMNRNKNSGFFSLTEIGLPNGTGLRLDKGLKGKKIITDYEYLTQFQQLSLLQYSLYYVPPNISEILNKLPNIHELWIGSPSGTSNVSYFKNLKHIEKLDIWTSGVHFSNLGDILNQAENLKEVEALIKFDGGEMNLVSKSLEKLNFEFNSDSAVQSEENGTIYLDTPNLTNLELTTSKDNLVPITVVIDNKNKQENKKSGSFQLDRIKFRFIQTNKFEVVGDPISVKNFIVIEPGTGSPTNETLLDQNFDGQLISKKTDIKSFLEPLDKDTLETLVFFNSSSDETDISYLQNYQNIKELAISINNMKDLESITSLCKLEKLSIESKDLESINGIEKLENISSLCIYGEDIQDYSALEKLENLKELKVPYTSLDKLPNLDKIESLVLIYEEDSPEKNIDLKGKFENAKVTFESLDYSFFWDYIWNV